ncbi:hypothetical protein M427DRAFT_32255 [Gonapodya prolifera JEL478]|uniref:Uncharacterized protein n=1 Tax=Gonapodya prolifera (strain JEL478) TaxID=1344416 RepID=A0A139AGJ0_GONPJ|nr:hypothetical protein M427DRAFT_32255 [Gonapodya prolifera JEL478]|eukprot:KXS15565.1 hypothetical protein M427DRAFT_32255 [Gonapodya prolifera JEL478]
MRANMIVVLVVALAVAAVTTLTSSVTSRLWSFSPLQPSFHASLQDSVTETALVAHAAAATSQDPG